MNYMLDINTCIYIIKKHPPNVMKKFASLKIGEICISSITMAELMYGVYKSHHQEKNRHALQEFTSPLEVLPFTEEVATHYGHIRAYLEKKGTPIGALDLMIAAHAQQSNSILVTNNKKELSRVVNLKIENWVHA
ncbi:MAG TPA: type II toxin-antitoxin system VapC family toxin [Gammaproteobacteria bacterium]|jgi:tRNA(fMet)-specific endonuclease VapC|nr:type II toxin-antitoxin system VapC family toxin [Gammaproteobacteria bacterium]